jgi:hypothetical protein
MRTVWLGACALLVASPAWSQPLTRDELLQALKARDQVIQGLQRRIEALERQRATVPPLASASPAAPPAPRPAVEGVSSAQDEVALEALSRTLVQKGGLVLRPGRFELVPSAAYSHSQLQGLTLVDTPEGVPTVADQRLSNDSGRATITLRAGLPWETQVELRAPYVWERQARALGNGVHAVNEGSGLGDVELALSHQLLHERGWRPDVVGGLSWRFATGRDPFRTRVAAVATGAGTDQFGARLTAVKASDPMVFYSTLAYAHDLPVRESFGRVAPGDAIRLDTGAILAVSPETSLTFGLSQEFRGKTQVDDTSIPGSDTVAASLQLGVGRVLSSRVLLDVTLGIGLTRDAPDYVFQVSTPIRFR